MHPHCPIKYGFDGKTPPPVPEESQKIGHFTASFDQRLWLFHRRWEPEPEQPIKATLMIVHGTVDHSGVYDELAKVLVSKGIAVIAMDMRGWGLSDGESMYLDSMETFVADVEALYKLVHEMPRFADVKPRFLLGKSVGGTVTAFSVAKHPDLWTGLLGLSGAYQVGQGISVPSPLVVSALRGIATFFPKIAVRKLFDEHLIVKDPEALQAWRDDKLCCKDKVRLGYALEGIRATQEVEEKAAPKINIPMLMMIGDADRVVTMSGHQLMVDKCQHSDKELKVYPGGYHNVLQEPSLKDQVISDIEAWILAHV